MEYGSGNREYMSIRLVPGMTCQKTLVSVHHLTHHHLLHSLELVVHQSVHRLCVGQMFCE
jgi:hypothetical protein